MLVRASVFVYFVFTLHWKQPKMKDIAVLCFLVQTPYLGKFWFAKLYAKISCPIKLQDFLIINISGSNASFSRIFYVEIFTKKRKHARLLLLIACVKACSATPKFVQIYQGTLRIVLGNSQVKNSIFLRFHSYNFSSQKPKCDIIQ